MIYLENTTSAQTVSIPRNDNGGTPSVNPRSYQEGYNAGFEAGEDVGYSDGVAYQKSLLSSTTITENGDYQSENGFSAVSVNVQTGITIPLTSITITANTAITETDKAYTGITVNVDTASTYNSGYTDGYASGETDGYNTGYASGYTSGETDGYNTGYASGYTSGETNGYASGYSSGYTSGETVGYNNGYSVGYDSGYTEGYDSGSTDGYESGYTSGSTDGYNDGYGEGIGDGEQNIINTFTAITATTNGVYGSTGHPLSSITVNVPQSGETEPIISVTGDTWFVLDHIFQYGEKINIKHVTFDYRAANAGRYQQLISGGYDEYLRIGGKGDVLYVTYGNTNLAQTNYILTNNEIELTPTEFDIDGVKVANVISSTHTWNTNMVLFANDEDGRDSVSGQTASVGEITITDSANTITAHYVPMLDENDVPCFYNTVSDNYIYAENGTPIYSAITVDLYQSGYTDGYASGYTSGETDGYNIGYVSGETVGENNIISTFSAMTATTNGNYGSSAHPLSAITVDVPQTGSSLPLSSITITGNTAITVNDKAYTGITVNVPSSSNVITRVDYICTDPLVDLSNLYIDTGIFPTTATTMRIKYIGTGYKPSAKILGYSWYGEEDVYNWAEDWEDYRFSFYPDIFQFHRQYLWDYNDSRLSTAEVNFTDEGAYVDLTFGNNYVYNNLTNTYVDTGDTQNYQAITNIPIMVNVSVIKLQSLEIWQGETKVFDGIAAYDNNGHIGLFDNITNTIVYNSALTMTYGTTGYTQQDLDNAYDSGYTSGYTSGYSNGYSSGYTSGQTVGYNSGVTDGSKAGLYYAYYPTVEGVTATTGASYYTVFPNLEDGKIIKCGVLSKNHFSNHILGGKHLQADPTINFGIDNINNEADFSITSEITSGYSLSYPLPISGDNHYSIAYMAISGGSYCFGLEVGGYYYGGFNPSDIHWTGTGISNEYNIIFNSDTISGMSLDYVIYKDIETGAVEHYYTIDPKTNEIHDWITGNDLPTYDANNTRVYNVLQSVLKI